MDKRMRFYSWLISLLRQKHLTLAEIIDKWRDATANTKNEELDQRTSIAIGRTFCRCLGSACCVTGTTVIAII